MFSKTHTFLLRIPDTPYYKSFEYIFKLIFTFEATTVTIGDTN